MVVGRIQTCVAKGINVMVKLDKAPFQTAAPEELMVEVCGYVPKTRQEAQRCAWRLRHHRSLVDLPNLKIGPQNAGKRARRTTTIDGRYISLKGHTDPIERSAEMRRRRGIMKAEVKEIAKAEADKPWPTFSEAGEIARDCKLSLVGFDEAKGTMKFQIPKSNQMHEGKDTALFFANIATALEKMGLKSNCVELSDA